MKFIYCLDEVDKEKLINEGYKLIKQQNIGDKVAYVFANNTNKICFESKNVYFSNKLTF